MSKKLLGYAFQSGMHRKSGLILAMLSISISVFLLTGVDKIKKETKNAFYSAISQTDLLVGARGSNINLYLFSLFGVSGIVNNISYESYREIAALPEIEWTVPLSLGDSHRGFRVLGTNTDYFKYYKYGEALSLEMAAGKEFADLFDVVVGSEVAEKLGYSLNRKVTITHGMVNENAIRHDDKPFRISGVLKKTGTPVDRTLYISLEGFEALHIDWRGGAPTPLKISAEQVRKFKLAPKNITSFLVGLKSKLTTFKIRRLINEYKKEPLMAVLPGVTAAELWRIFESAEKTLQALSAFVLLSGLLTMLITLMAMLNERRREIAVLKSIGANVYHIFFLFAFESAFIMIGGILMGCVWLYGSLFFLKDFIVELLGVSITLTPPDLTQVLLMLAFVPLGGIFSLLPAFIAFKRSIKDGLLLKN